jgi:hypothetical protein
MCTTIIRTDGGSQVPTHTRGTGLSPVFFDVAALVSWDRRAPMVWPFPPPTHGEYVERRLKRARPRPIAEVADGGMICIAGRVEAVEPLLVAPLTGRPCVFWAILVNEISQFFQTWELGHRDQGTSFLVVDPTRRARVIPDGARVALPFDSRLRVPDAVTTGPGRWGAATPPVMSGNERAVFDSMKIRNRPLATSTVRFIEYVIEPHSTIIVLGRSESEADDKASDLGYRDSPPRRPLMASARRTPLLIGTPPGSPSRAR